MNIAYLILAHNQPLQLLRLIDRLGQPNAWFYIHIDTKSADKEAIKTQFSGRKNVTIISNHDVNWMGFNMVRATIELLKLTYTSGAGFKYYVLLSGQDCYGDAVNIAYKLGEDLARPGEIVISPAAREQLEQSLLNLLLMPPTKRLFK